MNESIFYLIQVTSTLSVVPALLYAIWFLKKNGLQVKLFTFFLGIDLISDLSGWAFYLTKNAQANTFAHYIYDLIWALFWFWFIGKLSTAPRMKFVFLRAWMVLIPLGVLMFIHKTFFSYFELLTYILVAFTSGFCLLKLTEMKTDNSKYLIFWILLGIFFYSFGVCIIRGISFSAIAAKIWYAHNFINIATNVIYLIGFLMSRSSLNEQRLLLDDRI